jgi:ATP-dependent DNA ligase
MPRLSTGRLPRDPAWQYEIKLDGNRAVAFKADGELHLRSRNNNDFRARHPTILNGLQRLPRGTVLYGEIVAPHAADGRPSSFFRMPAAPKRRSSCTCSACSCSRAPIRWASHST